MCDANGGIRRQSQAVSIAFLLAAKNDSDGNNRKGASSGIKNADDTPRKLPRSGGKGNVAAGSDEQATGNLHDPFAISATRADGQSVDRMGGNICTDNGEIAGIEFEDVWATASPGTGENGSRGGTKASNKHNREGVKCVYMPSQSEFRGSDV